MSIYENGNRRVADYEHSESCTYYLYEGKNRVMFIEVSKKNIVDSDNEEHKKVFGFLNSFLEHGIENMTISDIYDSFQEVVEFGDGDITVYFKNGMQYEYSFEYDRYDYGWDEKLFFEINGKSYVAKLLHRDITYHELSTVTTDNVLDYISEVNTIDGVGIYDFFRKDTYNNVYISDYGVEVCTYLDVVERIWKAKHLKKTDYFNTGHFFKITNEVKCEFAKRKLLGEELPALLAVDSNGYGIFDGVSHIVTK